jgi:tRNA-dihydrouridine synthase B
MSCQSNNASEPSPAIAPGAEHIDPARFAAELGSRPGGPVDPRLRALVPGFDAPFFQAGLAGYSDGAMRIIARRHGCPYCVTEALLDRTLLAGGRGFAKADLGELHDNVPGGPEDHPLSCQIMGSDPREMAAAAIKAVEQRRRSERAYRDLAYPTGAFGAGSLTDTPGLTLSLSPDLCTPAEASFQTIDVNLACPVKKIKSKSRGGHWLTDPAGAIEILEAVRDAVPAHIPCTVKLRRSFNDTPEMARNFEDIFAAAYHIGYAFTTVHARTVEQRYIGPSRWTFLRDLTARHPDKLIFGSGDIWEVNDIFRMIAYTGVHAVSVARGCIGNPWIFRQARDMLRGEPPSRPTLAEQRAVLQEHFRLSVAINGEALAGRLMRKFGIRFAAHHPESELVRVKFIAIDSLASWQAVLDEHYAPDAPLNASAEVDSPSPVEVAR